MLNHEVSWGDEAKGKAKPRCKPLNNEGTPSLDPVPTPGTQFCVGATVLASAILEKTGMLKDLKIVLGSAEDAVSVANLAMHAVITKNPLYCACREAEVQKFIGTFRLTSPRASEFLQRIGLDSALNVKMSTQRASHVADGSFIAIDSTEVPSRSRNICLTELGKTKEGTFDTQVNVALLVNTQTGEPISYRMYAGNMHDIKSLPDQRKLWDEIGLKNKEITFIGDRAYLSKEEAVELDQAGYKFLFGAKIGNSFIDKTIDERNSELFEPANFIHNRRTYGIKENEVVVKAQGRETLLNTYVYRSTWKQEEEINELQTKLREFEIKWSRASETTRQKMRRDSLFVFYDEEDGTLKKNSIRFNEECYMKGFFALAGNVDYGLVEALDRYKERNTIEVDFKLMFQHLLKSTRVHSTQSFEALMLVTFTGLCILTYLNLRVKGIIDNENSPKGFSYINDLYTIDELLQNMRRIRLAYDAQGNPRLLNVVKRDLQLMEALGFPNLLTDPKEVERLLSADALIKSLEEN